MSTPTPTKTIDRPGSGGETVAFVHPSPPADIDDLALGDEKTLREYLTSITASGRDTWILGTYARLRRLGMDVKLVSRFPDQGICVAHRDDVIARRRPWRCFVIAVRADRDRTFHCHLEIVQSPANLEAASCHYVPHWPMPELVPRDPARGNRVERIGYFGLERNLAAKLRDRAFREALADLGAELVIRDDPERWNDFSDIDVVLAIRDGTPDFLASKPATKLFNAWIAGCPALVGDEPAYDYHGTPGTDFLRATSAEEVLEAIHSLRTSPPRYEDLRDRCLRNADLVNESATTKEWEAFIRDVARPCYARWSSAPRTRAIGARHLRYAVATLRSALRGNLRHRGYDFSGNPVTIRQRLHRRIALWVDRRWTAAERRARARLPAPRSVDR